MAFRFENLKVWQKSVDLSRDVYDLAKKFPKKEIDGLTSQINRAADFISLNIAKASTGQMKKEFYKFLEYSIRPGIEVRCLRLAKRKKFITIDDFQKFYREVEVLVIMVRALRKSITMKLKK